MLLIFVMLFCWALYLYKESFMCCTVPDTREKTVTTDKMMLDTLVFVLLVTWDYLPHHPIQKLMNLTGDQITFRANTASAEQLSGGKWAVSCSDMATDWWGRDWASIGFREERGIIISHVTWRVSPSRDTLDLIGCSDHTQAQERAGETGVWLHDLTLFLPSHCTTASRLNWPISLSDRYLFLFHFTIYWLSLFMDVGQDINNFHRTNHHMRRSCFSFFTTVCTI